MYVYMLTSAYNTITVLSRQLRRHSGGADKVFQPLQITINNIISPANAYNNIIPIR